MALIQEFERTGNLLFKYRGQIPVLIFLIALPVVCLTNQDWYAEVGLGHYNAWYITLCVLAFLISLAGLVLRAYTVSTTPKGTSGRNTRTQVADTLNTQGIYSVVRHPLYLANYLIWAGILVFTMNVWAFLIVSLLYCLYYERIMFAEEAFLRSRFGEQFEEWSARVPAFLPRLRNREKSPMTFSWKTFVRREYVTFYSTIFTYTLTDYLLFFLMHRHIYTCLPLHQWLRPSLWILAVATVLLITIHMIKHHTAVLKNDNRD
ncbi:MAG: DUF1295 domain-containing protein [Bacteroidales bacterium]|nr:DUF1295 domain-containing protein [Bacteroidales bacterium]